jgi:hypothetical protein
MLGLDNMEGQVEIRTQPDLDTGTMYRMPVVFGPSLGPRQRGDLGPYPAGASGARWQVVAGVRFRTDAGALAGLLPPHFSLAGPPTVSVTVSWLHDIGWLAGRGYNILRVDVPVEFSGADGRVSGNLTPVLWESLADPIITGREELGMSKLYADIPPLIEEPGRIVCSARWQDFEFFQLEIDGLEDMDGAAPVTAPAVLNYKYIPKTGSWGEPDAAYVTMSPPRPLTVTRKRVGRATFGFVPCTWEQLPTLAHIVNVLAALPVVETGEGSVTVVQGAPDGRDQRIVR